MKTTLLSAATAVSLALSLTSFACAQHYTQVNLVANASGVAPVTDPNLVNPWGLSRAAGSPWWVSDNGTGLSTLYNGAGAITPLVVTIPKSNPASTMFPTGTPTGTISNGSTTDFLLAPGAPAVFLFATVDGTISGWNPGVGIAPGGAPPSTIATVKVNPKNGSGYTGLTSATINGARFLYAANFTKGTVDVFDNAFNKVNLRLNGDGDRDRDDRPFSDDRLPRNFVPFNVQAIGNDIVVTFVLHEEGQPFETDGPGLGFVDIFSSDGRLLRRLEHGEWLNAPWGSPWLLSTSACTATTCSSASFLAGAQPRSVEPSPPTTLQPANSSDWCSTPRVHRSPSMAFGPSAPAIVRPPVVTTPPAHLPLSSISPPAPTTARVDSSAISNPSPRSWS